MNRLFVIALLVACNANVELGKRSEAQGQQSGGGLRVVRVLDGGLCSGKGTKADPLDCRVHTDYDGGVAGTGSAGDPITLVDDVSLVIFGDGSDGDLTLSGTSSLSRDVFYNDLTINAGARMFGGGVRIHVMGTLTLNGTIHADGNNGANALDGIAAAASCGTASAGAANGNVYYNGSASGGSGASTGGLGQSVASSLFATTGTAAGGPASTGVGNNGTDSAAVQGRAGGGGSGGGFVGTASGAGGAGGGSTVYSSGNGRVEDLHDLFSMYRGHPVAVSTNWAGSGPGGGGGSCGKDTVSATSREPGGGGGGGGAASVAILARRIVVGPSGKMTAIGGRGGNGGSCGTHPGDAGGGGGGGGGSGGSVWFVLGSGTMPGDSAFDVSGGAGGTGGTACAGGQNGGNGGHGGYGQVIKYRADGQL